MAVPLLSAHDPSAADRSPELLAALACHAVEVNRLNDRHESARRLLSDAQELLR